MREIEQDAARGSERHRLAIEIYCYYIKRYLGAYLAVMGGADAIVFTGGIGENSRLVRRLAVEGLSELGIAVDQKKNEANGPDISAGRVKVLVVPTNEELAIARDTRRLLASVDRKAPKPAVKAVEPPAAAFGREETARLVLLWARNPKMSVQALAAGLSRSLGREVPPAAVQKELARLALDAAASSPTARTFARKSARK